MAARYWHDVALGRGALLNVLNGGSALDLGTFHQEGGQAAGPVGRLRLRGGSKGAG